MPLADYDFDLPDALIAQAPLAERDASRLLVLDRATGTFAHRRFVDWPELLRSGDLVVLNDTRVVPARLLGRKLGSGTFALQAHEPGSKVMYKVLKVKPLE